MARLIVEQAGRAGSPGMFHPVDAFPVRIGRAPDNDIIIADPYVSPHHLTVAEGGSGWTVTDLGSTNGTIVDRAEPLSAPCEIAPGGCVQIGRTVLRFLDPSQEVPPALPLRPQQKAPAVTPLISFVTLLAAFVAALFDRALDTTAVMKPVTLVATTLPLLFFPLAWAGVWSLAGFIVRRSGDFAAQLVIASGAFLAFFPIAALSEYVDFYTSSVALADTTRYAGFGLLSTALLAASTRIAIGFIDTRRTIVAFSIGFGVVALLALSDHAHVLENKITPVYSQTLKAPGAPAGRAVSPEAFFNEGKKLFGK